MPIVSCKVFFCFYIFLLMSLQQMLLKRQRNITQGLQNSVLSSNISVSYTHLMHAEHLEAVFGVGPHTISVPRICDADDIDKSSFSNGISDDIFAKIVACIRIAVPYTGMIVSTRESQKTRERVLHLSLIHI